MPLIAFPCMSHLNWTIARHLVINLLACLEADQFSSKLLVVLIDVFNVASLLAIGTRQPPSF